MSSSNLLRSLFEYKAWANEELLEAIKLFDPVQHAAERHTAIRIFNHTYVVDRIFAANLQSVRHEYTAANTTETPTVEQLSADISASDRWYVEYVVRLDANALSETLDFTFTDGDPGRMSREEMLAHVVNHGSGHRGAICRIMAQLSLKPPRDLYTRYLHGSQPIDRRRA